MNRSINFGQLLLQNLFFNTRSSFPISTSNDACACINQQKDSLLYERERLACNGRLRWLSQAT